MKGAHLLINPRPPPLQILQPSPPRIKKTEKDYNNTERESRIERCGKRHGVFTPPRGAAAAEVGIKEEADEGPDGEVETGLPPRKGWA